DVLLGRLSSLESLQFTLFLIGEIDSIERSCGHIQD
ncbi:MAG: hypothetical protein, partial [Olavius algarvensis Gamma 1 endosymbiont]